MQGHSDSRSELDSLSQISKGISADFKERPLKHLIGTVTHYLPILATWQIHGCISVATLCVSQVSCHVELDDILLPLRSMARWEGIYLLTDFHDFGGRVMSCLWASRFLSVFVTISLYQTHRCSNIISTPTLKHTLKYPHTDTLKESKFFPIVKHFHNREPSITAGSSHLRHAPLCGSYFSLIDLYYYNAMITIEPLDGWLHPFLKWNDFACLAGTVSL